MFSFHHHLIFLLFLTSLLPVFSDLAADRSALLALQADLRGRTRYWNTSTSSSPCSWRGVVCDNTTNRVIELRLPGAGLRGQLNSIGNLTELRVLSLRNNALSGQLPFDLASCTQLEEIHLQGNSFSGEIPESFFSLTNLLRVNFAGNNFSGVLSPRFNNLTALKTLYLENNAFAGSLPDWNGLTNLKNFNVSFNGLTGSIPSVFGNSFSDQSFLGTSLCGRPLASCSSSDGSNLSGGAIAGIAVGSFFALIFLLFASFILWRTYKSRRKVLPQTSPYIPRSPANPLPNSERCSDVSSQLRGEERRTPTAVKNDGDGLVFLGKNEQVFSLPELLSASAEVMGKGTVGSTYKAYFESGIQVVVKRLKSVSISEVEFCANMGEMGSFHHHNLEPLIGYFYGREEKLILYQPMPKGSLSTLLHGYGSNGSLSLEMRARIAVGTASAIEYLHSISPRTIHGNIKSTNIFVTDYYEARVAEFGLTQLVSPVSKLNGYRAPEVLDTRSISQKADVYSFGVLLLELLSGRQPDRILEEEGTELPNWVQSVVEEKGTTAVVDPELLNFDRSEDRMVEFLLVALSCTSRSPSDRPSAAEVRRRVQRIAD